MGYPNIVGGESGKNARPMRPEWVRSIRDQCEEEGVPFFFKQWGGRNKKLAGRLLDGVTHDGQPHLDHGAPPTAAGRRARFAKATQLLNELRVLP